MSYDEVVGAAFKYLTQADVNIEDVQTINAWNYGQMVAQETTTFPFDLIFNSKQLFIGADYDCEVPLCFCVLPESSIGHQVIIDFIRKLLLSVQTKPKIERSGTILSDQLLTSYDKTYVLQICKFSNAPGPKTMTMTLKSMCKTRK